MPVDHYRMANFPGMNLKKIYGDDWKENGKRFPAISDE